MRQRCQLLLCLMLTALLISVASNLVTLKAATPQNPADGSYKPVHGTFSVQKSDIVLKDAKRSRLVPVKVYYPKTTGTYPVIIFSHAEGGSKDWYAYLGEYWASHGYISIHANHVGSDTSAMKNLADNNNDGFNDRNGSQRPRGGMMGMRTGLVDENVWLNRAKDISFIIDSFSTIESQISALKGKIDKNRIGVAGHSLGAQTALSIAGALVDTKKAQNLNLGDKRVKAFIAISLQGAARLGFDEKCATAITKPVMVIDGQNQMVRQRQGQGQGGPTGGQGAGNGAGFAGNPNRPGNGDFARNRFTMFDILPKGEKFEVTINGAKYFDFLDKKDMKGTNTAFQSYITMMTVAFWDSYLKDQPLAKSYLKADGMKKYSKAKVTVKTK